MARLDPGNAGVFDPGLNRTRWLPIAIGGPRRRGVRGRMHECVVLVTACSLMNWGLSGSNLQIHASLIAHRLAFVYE